MPGEQVQIDDFLAAGYQPVVERLHAGLPDRPERELEGSPADPVRSMHLLWRLRRYPSQPRQRQRGRHVLFVSALGQFRVRWHRNPVERLPAGRLDTELLVDLAFLGECRGGDVGQRGVLGCGDRALDEEVPVLRIQCPHQPQRHRVQAIGEEVGKPGAAGRQVVHGRFQLSWRHRDRHGGARFPHAGPGDGVQEAADGTGGPRLHGGHEITASEWRIAVLSPAGIHSPSTSSAASPIRSGTVAVQCAARPR
jgi:hypothetical protein